MGCAKFSLDCARSLASFFITFLNIGKLVIYEAENEEGTKTVSFSKVWPISGGKCQYLGEGARSKDENIFSEPNHPQNLFPLRSLIELRTSAKIA